MFHNRWHNSINSYECGAQRIFPRVQKYATKSIVELRTALFWVVTQVQANPYRCFGTTYQSYLLESFFFVSCPLKMRPIDCPESSARNYHHPLLNNPEKRSSHLFRGGNLKSWLRIYYRRLGIDVIVFLYTEYKAASSCVTLVNLPVDTVSYPSNKAVRTSNPANCDIPLFI